MFRRLFPIVIFSCGIVLFNACGSSVRYSSGKSAGSANSGREYVNDSPVAKAVAAARSWLGTPYKYGGTSRQGVDCSALMMFVFREAGESLPRTSRQQFMVGSAVERRDLRAGDLVFFNTSGSGVSHVGLFIGNDAFIHASSSQGVVREMMTAPYFTGRYMGARRIL